MRIIQLKIPQMTKKSKICRINSLIFTKITAWIIMEISNLLQIDLNKIWNLTLNSILFIGKLNKMTIKKLKKKKLQISKIVQKRRRKCEIHLDKKLYKNLKTNNNLNQCNKVIYLDLVKNRFKRIFKLEKLFKLKILIKM